MLNIPGHPTHTCEGPTRRELMRIGSLGLAGLHLPGFFLSQKAALANEIAKKYAGVPLGRTLERSRSSHVATDLAPLLRSAGAREAPLR